MKKLRWGIIGCGGIAESFMQGLKQVEEAEVGAVASKTLEKAKSFAEKFGIETYYDSYDEMLKDESIQVIYVSTTHNFHYENVLQCLSAGKHVLCEKAFTMNAQQAKHLRDLAREKELFLMEAMWTRFVPGTKELMKTIKEGRIGDVELLKVDFSFRVPVDKEHRLFKKELAGGALLDVGIYGVSYASMIFGGKPSSIKSASIIGETGVDNWSSHIFEYGNGKAAVVTASLAYYYDQRAIISGTKGYIIVPTFFNPTEFTIFRDGKETRFDFNGVTKGLYHEAKEVTRSILSGKKESQLMPLDETIDIMETMDQIRGIWGLKYPDNLEEVKR